MMWTDNKARHNLSHEAGRLLRAVLANKVCHTRAGHAGAQQSAFDPKRTFTNDFRVACNS